MPMQFLAEAHSIIGHLDFQQIELPEGGGYDFSYRETAAIVLAGDLFYVIF